MASLDKIDKNIAFYENLDSPKRQQMKEYISLRLVHGESYKSGFPTEVISISRFHKSFSDTENGLAIDTPFKSSTFYSLDEGSS